MSGSMVGRKAAYAWTGAVILGALVFALMPPPGVVAGILTLLGLRWLLLNEHPPENALGPL